MHLHKYTHAQTHTQHTFQALCASSLCILAIPEQLDLEFNPVLPLWLHRCHILKTYSPSSKKAYVTQKGEDVKNFMCVKLIVHVHVGTVYICDMTNSFTHFRYLYMRKLCLPDLIKC